MPEHELWIGLAQTLAVWGLAVVAVEAATELLVASDFFYPVRRALFGSKILNRLMSCGYCASVWIAGSIAWALPGKVVDVLAVDILIRTLVLHRLANWAHGEMK